MAPAPVVPSPALQLGPLSRPFNLTASQRTRAAPPKSTFVRPDCPPVGKEEQQEARGPFSVWPKANEEPPKLARSATRFRSALEQVSFETNKKLYDGEQQTQRARKPLLGLLGL